MTGTEIIRELNDMLTRGEITEWTRDIPRRWRDRGAIVLIDRSQYLSDDQCATFIKNTRDLRED